jgi:hypothetical protein
VEKPTEPLGQRPREPAEIGGIAITRRFFVVAVIAVCVLSAAIGSAISLVAQTGPAGPRGKPGPAGPRGPKGKADTAAIEAQIEALRGEVDVSGLEERDDENEERIEGLEELLGEFEQGGLELFPP